MSTSAPPSTRTGRTTNLSTSVSESGPRRSGSTTTGLPRGLPRTTVHHEEGPSRPLARDPARGRRRDRRSGDDWSHGKRQGPDSTHRQHIDALLVPEPKQLRLDPTEGRLILESIVAPAPPPLRTALRRHDARRSTRSSTSDLRVTNK
eukprot:SAG31_NODE_2630_length_5350_cov_1.706723_2_plen_148_part_00